MHAYQEDEPHPEHALAGEPSDFVPGLLVR
jgi:hypothetical protein